MEEILSAVIGGLSVAIPSIIATLSANKKTTTLITYRVDQLEKKVEKHNSVVERTFRIEDDVKHIKEQVNDLKKYH